MAEKTGEEKFSIANVSFKMQTIEDHFAAFSDTLAKLFLVKPEINRTGVSTV